MSKSSPSAIRTTLYHLLGVSDLRAAIRSKYLNSSHFVSSPTTVNGRTALLVKGEIYRELVAWGKRLEGLTGMAVETGNKTAAAVLLIKEEEKEDQAWALSYGMGFQLLKSAYVDTGFGLRIAIRTAMPDAIQSLTRNELDHRSRTDRSSIPSGEALRGFGIGNFGEIITRICGEAKLDNFTAQDKIIRIRAADSLSVPLGTTPKTLTHDLDAIAKILTEEPKEELKALEQFVRVKDPSIIKELEAELKVALSKSSGSNGRLALGWPHERISENGTPSSFKLLGTGKHKVKPIDDLPTLEYIRKAISTIGSDDVLDTASKIKIQLFRDSDGDEPISQAIPTINWLLFELELHKIRYCLFDSHWYAIDVDYAERLQVHINKIFEGIPPVELPIWDLTKTCSRE